MKDVVVCTLFEGFQYAPEEALETRGLASKAKRTGAKMIGKKWDIEALERGDKSALEKRFPRLAKRFA